MQKSFKDRRGFNDSNIATACFHAFHAAATSPLVISRAAIMPAQQRQQVRYLTYYAMGRGVPMWRHSEPMMLLEYDSMSSFAYPIYVEDLGGTGC